MPNDGLSYASAVDIGRQKRRAGGINEDSLTVQLLDDWHRSDERHGLVFALADGAGGPDTGDVASYLATTTAVAELAPVLTRAHAGRPETVGVDAESLGLDGSVFSDSLDGADIRAAIEDAVRASHRRIVEYVREAPVEKSATTVVVGLYDGKQLHYGWVGDSRLYVLNESAGTIRLLSEDHSETQSKVDDEGMDPVAARVHPSTRINRYLGGDKYVSDDVEVDTGTINVHRDDIVFATSDGLVDAYVADAEEPSTSQLYERYRDDDDKTTARERILDAIVTHNEIRETIFDASTLDDAASSLVDLANDRGGKDNLSLFLLADGTASETPDSAPYRGTALPDTNTSHTTGSSLASVEGSRDGNSKSVENDISAKPGLSNLTTGDDYLIESGDMIGSNAEAADIVVRHRFASREHCIFVFEDGNWYLEDQSENGTVVQHGDQRVHVADTREQIGNGDLIVVPGSVDTETDPTGARQFKFHL